VLRECGMYKFFQIGSMRAQKILLNLLIYYWHPYAEAFMFGGKSLTVIVEYIYFITSFSIIGEAPKFTTHWGGVQTINDYINEYCEDGTKKKGSQVYILYTIVHIVGSNSLHLASRSQMKHGFECLRPMMFNWSTTILSCMKAQITIQVVEDQKIWVW
jgi:hypothetical protein